MKKRWLLFIPIMLLLTPCSTKKNTSELPTIILQQQSCDKKNPVLQTNAAVTLQNPILFVTQFPVIEDFATIVGTFGNHEATLSDVGRGGDLYIRYTNGTLRNLTREAGFGTPSGFQGKDSIAVRDPAVHWNGTKAIFSMVIGAPTKQYESPELLAAPHWQLYEVTGFLKGETINITKLPNQPPAPFNNIQPTYASNGDIIFVSDRPRNGALHLYPQHDEYESLATPTGLWRITPNGENLILLEHAPSGSFTPIVDSFGRIVFTRWDHLQQDQQAKRQATFNAFNFTGEEASSTPTQSIAEQFPEPWGTGQNEGTHSFNHFFPWQLNQDGTGEETLNHIGRHELIAFFFRSVTDDNDVKEFDNPSRENPNLILNLFQIREDPKMSGRYIGVDAPEFETYSSGQLIAFDAPPSKNASKIKLEYLTPRSTFGYDQSAADHSGHYRNPLPLSDGTLIASHTDYKGDDGNICTADRPSTPYDFRLKTILKKTGASFFTADKMLTDGIIKNVDWYDPDIHVYYNGPFWELSPVEVVAREKPPVTGFALDDPEKNAFQLEGVDTADFLNDLREKNLAVIVVRNATSRDDADRQQPFNLKAPNGTSTDGTSTVGTSTVGTTGKVYDISHMQFFQADQIRSWRGNSTTAPPKPGRRVIAQALHDPDAVRGNQPLYTNKTPGPAGSVPIFSDGSAAIYVPTRRAMVWQSVDPAGKPIVRERYWITFQPGEIRVCNGCHGVNEVNQAGLPASTNTALAFREMLKQWKDSRL
ncbi:MAG: hypothetical protein AAB035_03415 [Nitrospirota bacterium]